ncbi:MAG: multidrug efflux SMR transporter [Gammaproteobacteria bacterium]|nr:multidrug efflux SMR transporter [Gammaproteobacteria bacterium]
MAYVYLCIAIISEVIATSALKASAEFTRLVPSIVVVVGYSTTFYFLALTLKTIPLGIAYAIWSGIGMALIALVGVAYFKQSLDLPAVAGIGMIAAGVITIQLFSKTAQI